MVTVLNSNTPFSVFYMPVQTDMVKILNVFFPAAVIY